MKILLIIFLTFIFSTSNATPEETELFKEEFNDLSRWQPFYFRGIAKKTGYRIIRDGEGSFLEAAANGSASALIMKSSFDVFSYPHLRWRWKIRNVHRKGNAREKKGDDYPLRVYIVFEYSGEGVPLGMKIKYHAIRMFYGGYPPHSSLNYIWANRSHSEKIISSPYSDRVKLYVLRSGAGGVNKWMDEAVNIVKDYRLSFGKNPPRRARIAIMADGDNTGGSVLSHIDFITLSSGKR